MPSCSLIPGQPNKAIAVDHTSAGVLDLITGSWIATKPLSYSRWGGTTAAIGSKVYAAAGGPSYGIYTNFIEEYDYDTNSWTVIKDTTTTMRGNTITLTIPAAIFNCIGTP